jgi:hypothetical protein
LRAWLGNLIKDVEDFSCPPRDSPAYARWLDDEIESLLRAIHYDSLLQVQSVNRTLMGFIRYVADTGNPEAWQEAKALVEKYG